MDDTNSSREPSAQTPESAEADIKTTSSASIAGMPNPSRPRAKFDAAENLPGVDPELTTEEIIKLMYQGPTVRKNYPRYFQTRGLTRKEFFPLLLERLPSGELKHPEKIIASNLRNWQGTLHHFEDPVNYDAKGQPRSQPRAL